MVPTSQLKVAGNSTLCKVCFSTHLFKKANPANLCFRKGFTWQNIYYLLCHKSFIQYKTYKRPLDSYACPYQSKEHRTYQSTFLCGKNILNWRIFAGKSKMCVHSYSFLAQKALFLPPLQTLITTHIDPRYILFFDQGVQLSDEVPFVKYDWWV